MLNKYERGWGYCIEYSLVGWLASWKHRSGSCVSDHKEAKIESFLSLHWAGEGRV